MLFGLLDSQRVAFALPIEHNTHIFTRMRKRKRRKVLPFYFHGANRKAAIDRWRWIHEIFFWGSSEWNVVGWCYEILRCSLLIRSEYRMLVCALVLVTPHFLAPTTWWSTHIIVWCQGNNAIHKVASKKETGCGPWESFFFPGPTGCCARATHNNGKGAYTLTLTHVYSYTTKNVCNGWKRQMFHRVCLMLGHVVSCFVTPTMNHSRSKNQRNATHHMLLTLWLCSLM